MKPFSKPLGIALAIACGLGAGFAIRAWRAPNLAAEPASSRKTSPETSPRPHAKTSLLPASALVSQAQSDLSLSTGVTRWLVWMTAVEKAKLSDFPALARMGKDLPGAIRMLAARWIDLDPRHLFESCVAGFRTEGFPSEELASLLFEDWIKRDPKAAIAALSTQNGFDSLRMTTINTLMRSDPELALITMSDWQIDSYGPDMSKVAAWAGKDPRHAAEVALNHPAGYATQLALKSIGETWGNLDPAAALTFAAGHSGAHANELAAAVMAAWAQRDLTKASGWLSQANEATHSQLLPTLMESWGRKDPAAALAWCMENATGSGQKEAVAGLIKGVASKDITSAANLVSSLEPSPARAQAAGAFVEAIREKNWFPTPFGRENKTLDPQALAWLKTLDPDSLKSALGIAQYGWSSADPQSLADFLTTPAGAPLASSVGLNLALALCRKNPTDALKWADSMPEAQRANTQTTVFNAWRNTQPDAALDWLSALPRHDPRRNPFIRETTRYTIDWKAAPPETQQTITDLILTNPAAAKTAINALPISGQGKADLIKLTGAR
jgi:hypothetical protein